MGIFAGVFSEVVSSHVFRIGSLFSLASFPDTFIPSGQKGISNQHPPNASV